MASIERSTLPVRVAGLSPWVLGWVLECVECQALRLSMSEIAGSTALVSFIKDDM